jgi:hypothetical protein
MRWRGRRPSRDSSEASQQPAAITPDYGFEPVSVKTQPVSRLAVPEFRILKIHRAEKRLRILGVSHEISDIPLLETGPLAANLLKCRRFSECRGVAARDPGGWLGRQDSNRAVSNSNRSPQRVGADRIVSASEPDSPYNQNYQVKILTHARHQEGVDLGLVSTATIRPASGWDAELKIPLKPLGWDGDPKKIRGNFYSILGRGLTRSYWSTFLPRAKHADFHQPQFFETLLRCG